jgi:hypothetical protein
MINQLENQLNELFKLKNENERLTESNLRHLKAINELQNAQLLELSDVLYEDVLCTIKYVNEADTQPNRRLFIKTAFSFIEGLAFILKQEVLIVEANKKNTSLTPEELLLLKDKVPSLGNNGLASESERFAKTVPNVLFAFKIYAKTSQIADPVDSKPSEWKPLKKLVHVRNRITHPKSLSEMTISDNEFMEAYICFLWLRHCYLDLLEKKIKKLSATALGNPLYT